METIKERINDKKKLQAALGIENPMAVPRIEKVVINSGIGEVSDAKKREFIVDRISRICGQKAILRPAKKSIASFKTRKGQAIGVMCTLRGARMYDFLDRLIHVAIPRMRDFKGISLTSVDAMGNLSIGVSENTIFPETGDEDVRDIFGFTITIVTSAKGKKEALSFLSSLGIPLAKDE